MARRLSQFCVNILLLWTFLQTNEIRCLRRLPRRKLSVEADDIRSILSSTLDEKPSEIIENNKKREASSEDIGFADSKAEEDVASESKDASVYDDDVDDDYIDQQRDFETSDHKRSVEASVSAEKPENQADEGAYEETDLRELKDVDKSDVNNENDYNDDLNADSSVLSDNNVDEVKARSINPKDTENLKKTDNRRSAYVEEANSELDFEKQIEDQIQQRIDSIKEDIKREIERKQQIREIEANNAKYDELELNREEDEMENGVDKLPQSARSKRSDVEVDNDGSISRNPGLANGLVISSQEPEFRGKRSDLDEADKNKENEKSPLVLPVKKRSLARRMTIVEKNYVPAGKRQERSSILIPERGHAEVKDELPADLTLGANLRNTRSDPSDTTVLDNSRTARSVVHHEAHQKLYRRDVANELNNEDGTGQDSFLFAVRENPNCRSRRRRNRERKKAQKHPHRSTRRRTIRESSMDDGEIDEERDKRAMPLAEDIALEYKESFGGLQADSSGALGRFKRIRRSPRIS